MNEKDKKDLKTALCIYLPYNLKGKVTATGVDTHHVDMEGFYAEVDFDVDVELDSINVDTEELFVIAITDNEDLYEYIYETQSDGILWTIEEFIPYLRSLDSMTEKEAEEYESFIYPLFEEGNSQGIPAVVKVDNMDKFIEWICIHKLDYFGLIKRKLALEAKENIYEFL